MTIITRKTNKKITKKNTKITKKHFKHQQKKTKKTKKIYYYTTLQKIADKKTSEPFILVPFRASSDDNVRNEHLKKFVEHFKNMMPNTKIYIIEQSQDGRKFNRGALLNIGFRILSNLNKKDKDFNKNMFIFHDIDLLPLDKIIPYYKYNSDSAVHIGWSFKNYYNFEHFFGQIVSLNGYNYIKMGGFPNYLWGWGGEDDVMRKRLVNKNIKIIRPLERENMFISLEHKKATSNPELLAVKRKINDTNSNVFSIKWKTLHTVSLAPNIKKITVEIL